MPRSVRLHPDHKETVRLTLACKGFLTQGDLAAHLGIALSTISNFFNCVPVSIAKFEQICEALELDTRIVIQPDQSSQGIDEDPFVPRPFVPSHYKKSTWVGRESLITELLGKLQGQTRLLWVTGISGVGKTALAECLAARTQNPDVSFHRINFDVEGESQDFTTSAEKILSELGEKELDSQERNDPKRLTDRLLHKLQTHPYWIQLDALERLFHTNSATEFADAHWLAFLQRCLDSEFPSRLVLTAQALPTALTRFEDDYPQQWHSITLQGLDGEGEDSEQLELFIKNGLTRDTTNEQTLRRIGQIYEGHPLVLQVIAKEILAKPFKGDVASYWQRYSDEFEQVARELQTQRVNPALYSQRLQNQVRQRIEVSLKRLPADPLDLLCRSAVYRRPVPETFWLAMIDDRAPTQKIEAYRVLGDRALIEKEGIYQGQFLIRQHNLIREITYDLLLRSNAEWKTAENLAATFWLIQYQPQADASNLEKMRGYLESFYHNYNIKAWTVAKAIFLFCVDTSTRDQLHSQLGTWGYYQEQVELCIKFLELAGTVGDLYWVGKALGCLGNAYYSTGNYPKAVEYFEKKRSNTRITKDRQGEGEALGSLGNVYRSIGKYSQAINCCEQALDILEEVTSLKEKIAALGNLGSVYLALGEYEKAIEYYEKSLDVNPKSQQFSKKLLSEEAYIFANLGSAYSMLKDFSSAEKYYRKALLFGEENSDIQLQLTVLSGFGNFYEELEDYPQAKVCFQNRLNIAREIHDLYGEAYALNRLGMIFSKLEEFSEALEYFREARLVCKRTSSLSYEAEILKNTAILNHFLGNINSAVEDCQQALALATELGIPLAAECEALQLKIENEQSKMAGEGENQ